MENGEWRMMGDDDERSGHGRAGTVVSCTDSHGERSGSDLDGTEFRGQCGISAWLASAKKKRGNRKQEKRQEREAARMKRNSGSGGNAGNPNAVGSEWVGFHGSLEGGDLSCMVELCRNSWVSCRHWKAIDCDKLRAMVKKLRCQACHRKGKTAWNQEAWVCLACMHIGCSDISPDGKMRREEKEVVGIGHAWQHWLLCNHPLAFLGGSNPPVFWCFACKLSPSLAMETIGSKKAMKVTPVDNIRAARTVKGLRNLGNTCFFNSAVQSLLSLDLLRDYLSRAEGEGPLITSLRTLYLETTSTGSISSSKEAAENGNSMKGERGASTASDPEPLFTAICKRAPRFQGSRQQDSHELLKCLLDGLHLEEQASYGSSSNPSSSSKSSFSSNSSSSSNSSKKSSSISPFSSHSTSSNPSKKSSSVSSPSSNSSFSSNSSSKASLHSSSRSINPSLNKTAPNVKGILSSLELDSGILNHSTTIVERIFGGQLSSTVCCCDCGHTSVKHEPFHDLSLQIPSKQSKKSSGKTFFRQGSAAGSKPSSTPSNNERGISDPCSRRTLKSMLGELRSKRELRPLQGELQLEISSPAQGQGLGQGLQCTDGIHLSMDSHQSEKPALCEDSIESNGFRPYCDELNTKSERVEIKTLRKLGEMKDGQGLEEGNVDFKSPSYRSEEQDEDVDYLEGLSKLFQEEEEEVGHSTLRNMNGHCDAPIETMDIPPMSLESCLADFTGLELLSGENAWECEHCESRKRSSEKRPPTSQTKKLVGGLSISFQGESLLATGAKRSSKGHAISRVAPNGKALASDSRSGMGFNSSQMNLTEGSLTKPCSDDYSGKSHSSECVKQYKFRVKKMGDGTGDGIATQNEVSSKQKGCSRHVKASTCLSRADRAVPFHTLFRISQDASLLRLKLKSRNAKNIRLKHGSGKFVLRAATKRLLISRIPLVLIIHLKRFTQDHRGRLSKLGGHVSFPECLDLHPFLDSKCPGKENCNYRLVGVVEHSGTMRGGHYVAYVRGPTMNQETGGDVTVKNDWYYISDSYVQKSSLNDVLKSEAYILLYEKNNI